MNEFEKKLAKSLAENGYLIPENVREVKQYLKNRELEDVPPEIELDSASEKKRESYKVKKKDSPDSKLVVMTSSSSDDLASLSKQQIYFRRVVLAGEIVKKLYSENTFGHVKFQKLMYLSEKICQYNLSIRYSKQAAGPMDTRFIHSIDREFKKQNWFDVKQEGPYKKYVYTPLPGLSKQGRYYEKYYAEYDEKIRWLLETFRSSKTDQVELIATIFAGWEELLNEHATISDDAIIEKVYRWSKEKKKFSRDRIIEGIRWMEENNLYPN
ncbi:hypothetical protein [Tunicatimonas pelagia]|uniref:hypothetical protein n=1 Tax=Tunicatimonas pelagia TaxID=931531 RepID=UPI00266707C8|nr:hypothetical protein [Tunicatimonas pelagia]WKN46437.1 hypothetical protein P0M28_30775 [Tunicatimonas pelagia]